MFLYANANDQTWSNFLGNFAFEILCVDIFLPNNTCVTTTMKDCHNQAHMISPKPRSICQCM